MAEFVRDASHWLKKLSPDEWVRAGLNELARARAAYEGNNPRAGLAGAKRAAGMALNGVLLLIPNESWGRSYVDHLDAVAKDESELLRLREACALLSDTPLPGAGKLVALRTDRGETRVLEAAKDVIAHAYAIVRRAGA